MNNLEEIKRLIKKYEEITPEKIENVIKTLSTHYCANSYMIMKEITGFGSTKLCEPCHAVNSICEICGLRINSLKCYAQETYDNIINAKNTYELMCAIKERVKFIKENLNLK